MSLWAQISQIVTLVIQAEQCAFWVLSACLGYSLVGMRVCPQKLVMFWVSLKLVWACRMRTMHSPQFRQMQQMPLLQTLPPQVCRRTGVTSCTASYDKQVCVTIIGWNASGWINRLFWTYILEDFNQTLQCLLEGPHAEAYCCCSAETKYLCCYLAWTMWLCAAKSVVSADRWSCYKSGFLIRVCGVGGSLVLC